MAQPETEPDTSEIATRAALSPAANAVLQNGMTPDGYLVALTNAGLSLDALHFLAHWLEKREAVWWGCQCLWHSAGKHEPAPLDADVQVIVRWVLEPGEESRRRCQAIAEQRASAPVGFLALAAFGSGGSISEAGQPEVLPPGGMTARSVAAALLMGAAVAADPAHAQKQFVHLGLDIAHGKNLWN